jgi:hypothetical protein
MGKSDHGGRCSGKRAEGERGIRVYTLKLSGKRTIVSNISGETCHKVTDGAVCDKVGDLSGKRTEGTL